jgi:hypothetical protein
LRKLSAIHDHNICERFGFGESGGITKMNRVFLSVLMAASLAFAQQGKIADRKENQQDRIANGVKNGSLTPHETAHLENKESKLNKEIRTDRKANGGNLTNNEKKQINQQQNKLSNNIYKDKHNGATQHP